MVFNNAISWFEIGTSDLNRATKFYETIFGVTLTPLDLDNIKMRMFPLQDMMTKLVEQLLIAEVFISLPLQTVHWYT